MRNCMCLQPLTPTATGQKKVEKEEERAYQSYILSWRAIPPRCIPPWKKRRGLISRILWATLGELYLARTTICQCLLACQITLSQQQYQHIMLIKHKHQHHNSNISISISGTLASASVQHNHKHQHWNHYLSVFRYIHA